MPWARAKPCPYSGCRNMQPCPVHHRERTQPRKRDTRPNSHQRGYGGKEWTKVRMRVIWRDKACCFCGGSLIGVDNKPVKGATVHHITPKPEGTDDPSNLTACHAECHRQHHRVTRT